VLGNYYYLDISLLRVQNLVPGHEVRESPVVLLAVEQVGDVPLECWPLSLVQDSAGDVNIN